MYFVYSVLPILTDVGAYMVSALIFYLMTSASLGMKKKTRVAKKAVYPKIANEVLDEKAFDKFKKKRDIKAIIGIVLTSLLGLLSLGGILYVGRGGSIFSSSWMLGYFAGISTLGETKRAERFVNNLRDELRKDEIIS